MPSAGRPDRAVVDERGTRWRVTEEALAEMGGAGTVLDKAAKASVSYRAPGA